MEPPIKSEPANVKILAEITWGFELQNRIDSQLALNSPSTGLPQFSQENISDFVAKKREMFLVQMSLDVKKAEILKLDARAKDKEEAGAGRLRWRWHPVTGWTHHWRFFVTFGLQGGAVEL